MQFVLCVNAAAFFGLLEYAGFSKLKLPPTSPPKNAFQNNKNWQYHTYQFRMNQWDGTSHLDSSDLLLGVAWSYCMGSETFSAYKSQFPTIFGLSWQVFWTIYLTYMASLHMEHTQGMKTLLLNHLVVGEFAQNHHSYFSGRFVPERKTAFPQSLRLWMILTTIARNDNHREKMAEAPNFTWYQTRLVFLNQ